MQDQCNVRFPTTSRASQSRKPSDAYAARTTLRETDDSGSEDSEQLEAESNLDSKSQGSAKSDVEMDFDEADSGVTHCYSALPGIATNKTDEQEEQKLSSDAESLDALTNTEKIQHKKQSNSPVQFQEDRSSDGSTASRNSKKMRRTKNNATALQVDEKLSWASTTSNPNKVSIAKKTSSVEQQGDGVSDSSVASNADSKKINDRRKSSSPVNSEEEEILDVSISSIDSKNRDIRKKIKPPGHHDSIELSDGSMFSINSRKMSYKAKGSSLAMQEDSSNSSLSKVSRGIVGRKSAAEIRKHQNENGSVRMSNTVHRCPLNKLSLHLTGFPRGKVRFKTNRSVHITGVGLYCSDSNQRMCLLNAVLSDSEENILASGAVRLDGHTSKGEIHGISFPVAARIASDVIHSVEVSSEVDEARACTVSGFGGEERVAEMECYGVKFAFLVDKEQEESYVPQIHELLFHF